MKLIVLPGMDGTGEMRGALAAVLRTSHEVIIVSYPKDKLLRYPELADLVVQGLPQGQPFALIGESFSGPVATLLAARKPDGLKAVVFAASFARTPAAFPKEFGWLANLVPLNTPWLLRLAQPFTFGRWRTEALDRLLAAAVLSVPARTLAFRIRQVLTVDVLAELAGEPVPMLYIRPTHDNLVPARASREMKAANPALKIAEVEGPHFVLQAKPEDCAGRIRAFLTSI